MISIRLSKTDEKELEELSKFEGKSKSEYIRDMIKEKLEDAYDYNMGEQALKEYERTLESYPLKKLLNE